MSDIARARPDLRLSELVFEPKRAFLGVVAPDELADTVCARAAALGVPLRIALPTVIRSWDEALLKRWLKAFKARGVTRFELGNIGALELLRAWGLSEDADLVTDFSLYALNASAAEEWLRRGFGTVTLSIEDDRENLSKVLHSWPAGLKAQAILFKDTPLFIAEACSLTALHNGCPTAKVCGYRSLEIENPAGERFMVAHESCKSIVYGKKAYSVTHFQQELLRLGVGLFRLDFLTRPYDSEGLTRVIDAALAGQPIIETHAANYERGLT